MNSFDVLISNIGTFLITVVVCVTVVLCTKIICEYFGYTHNGNEEVIFEEEEDDED